MRTLASLTLVAAAALLPGCIAAAAAAGAAAAYGYVRYTDNEAYRDYRANVDEVFDAAASTLRQQGLRVRPGVRFADVRGELQVQDVQVRITANSSISTRATVRVGTFSNAAHRERAAAILDGIGIRLGE